MLKKYIFTPSLVRKRKQIEQKDIEKKRLILVSPYQTNNSTTSIYYHKTCKKSSKYYVKYVIDGFPPEGNIYHKYM